MNVMTDASTGICFFKTVIFNHTAVTNDVWVALSFFIGLGVVLAIYFASLGVYYFQRSRRKQQVRPRIAPAALIATAVMGRVSEVASCFLGKWCYFFTILSWQNQNKEDMLNFTTSKR